jgi:hypothetical protein
MPVLENSIGGLQFFDLVGAIFYAQEQLELLERPGVQGTGVRRLGARGQPFELVSITYLPNWSTALAVLGVYHQLPAANAVTVIRNGTDHGTFKVLEVSELETRAVLGVAGVGVPSTYEIRQVVRWILQDLGS